MLFTIASVSLPYSDDVGEKAKNRFLATLIGGGYLSCYMTGYLRTFLCATFGALGGAVISMASTGFSSVGGIVLLRIIYIAIGIAVAIAFNCFVFPINRKRATRYLAQKYIQVSTAVSQSYGDRKHDPQLYYHLLLQTHQLEDKLRQNAKILQWEDVHVFLLKHQMEIQDVSTLEAARQY